MDNNRRRRRSGLFIITIAVLVLFGAVMYRRQILLSEKRALEEKYKQFQLQYEEELEKAKVLASKQAYMQTILYIEDVAREKLGLVYETEVILRAKDDSK